MLLRKSWSLLSMLLLSLIAFSCAQVPNVPICKEITPDRGYCSYTLEPGGFFVDEQHPYAFNPKKPEELSTWWEQRPLMLQVPAYSWSELKKFIIKQCRTKKCRNGVGQWMDKLEKSENKGVTDEHQVWNEPEFENEIIDMFHQPSACGEQDRGNGESSGDRGSEIEGAPARAGSEKEIQDS